MTPTKDDYIELCKRLSMRPVAVNPAFIMITQSVTAGYLLSQLVYWADRGETAGGWIYKTNYDLQQELHLTRHEMLSAKAKLRNLRLIEVQFRGCPAITFYRINWEYLTRRILDFSQ